MMLVMPSPIDDHEHRLARERNRRYVAKKRLDPEWRARRAGATRKYLARKRLDPEWRDRANAGLRAYYQLAREQYSVKAKAKYAANPDPQREAARAYRAIKMQDPTWVEQKKAKERARYQEHREEVLVATREWRTLNRDKRNAQLRERIRETPLLRLSYVIRNAVRVALLGKEKSARTFIALGYTVDQLERHLERQFKDGMSWDNYGHKGWHIDHIVPISAFNFSTTDDPDFKACWALSNLRPLWGSQNVRKQAKRTHLL